MTQMPTVPLGQLLRRRKDEITLDDLTIYPRLTIRLNGKGIEIRDRVPGSEIGTKKQFIARKGQLVLSKIDARNGAFGILPPEGDLSIITGNFWAFDHVSELVDTAYLEYFTKTKAFIELCVKASSGTTNRLYLQEDKFLLMEIPLPPLPEQRRLVERIDALAAKIEEAKRLRETADKQRDQLPHQAAESLFRNCGWSHVPLANLLLEDSKNGIGTRPNDEPPGVQILRISAGTSRADGVVEEGDHKYLPVTKKQLESYRLKKDDLLACRFNGNLRYVGRFSIYHQQSGQEQVYPDKLIRFRVDQTRVLPEFVKLAMNSPIGRERIEAFCATTAGNIGISASELKSVPVPVPPIGIQKNVIAYLHEVQVGVAEADTFAKELSQEINAMLPSILDRAFRGEL
jgi:type I restriction enzyme S subunit